MQGLYGKRKGVGLCGKTHTNASLEAGAVGVCGEGRRGKEARVM